MWCGRRVGVSRPRGKSPKLATGFVRDGKVDSVYNPCSASSKVLCAEPARWWRSCLRLKAIGEEEKDSKEKPNQGESGSSGRLHYEQPAAELLNIKCCASRISRLRLCGPCWTRRLRNTPADDRRWESGQPKTLGMSLRALTVTLTRMNKVRQAAITKEQLLKFVSGAGTDLEIVNLYRDLYS